MVSIESRSERIAVSLVAFTAVGWWAYSAFSISMFLPARRVQFVPDDAYYYLTLARNFAKQGQWTFDSGVSLTTGFHPLHAYVLSAIYSLTHPSPEQFVGYSITLSILLVLPAVLLAASLAVLEYKKTVYAVALFCLDVF